LLDYSTFPVDDSAVQEGRMCSCLRASLVRGAPASRRLPSASRRRYFKAERWARRSTRHPRRVRYLDRRNLNSSTFSVGGSRWSRQDRLRGAHGAYPAEAAGGGLRERDARCGCISHFVL